MKFRSLHKWKDDPSLEGLLFFAQRMEELLFDYTLDSYKPSALNAPFLCQEALQLIEDIEDKIIEPANLVHVLKELEWSVQGDKLAKSLLDVDLNYYILHDQETSISEKRKRLEALSRTIGPTRYLSKCKKLLKQNIESKSKANIAGLANFLTTTLINIGYSKTFLYNKTLDYFFIGDEPKIETIDCLDDYFEFFNTKVHYYDTLFLVDPLIKEVSVSVKAFLIEVHDEIPEEFAEFADKFEFTKSDEFENYEYVEIKKVSAFDHQTARSRAERKIDNLSDLFSLFYHKNQITWRRDAIILRKCCDKSASLERPHKGAMEKGFDYKPKKAAKALNKLISSFELHDGGSFQKFNRVADLHGICISNDVIENQLVNLWTSIETLVPSHVGGNKIGSIINFILPFITVNYVKRLIERFVSDLFLWDKNITRKILNKVPNSTGKSIYVKSLILLSIKQNEDIRQELYAALKDFHLLRFRAFNLSNTLTDIESIKKLIDTHKKKVTWQVRRIYRTRNLIVHSGRTPKYTETLIENGHDYLDQMMEGVMNYSCGDYKTQTLEQVFELARIRQIKFERALSSLKSIDEENLEFLYSNENL
ncbi:MAG: hypothetical protein AB2665_14885 [Candidatus Thiodiazotropha sp.]